MFQTHLLNFIKRIKMEKAFYLKVRKELVLMLIMVYIPIQHPQILRPVIFQLELGLALEILVESSEL
jgi:hypothetical protein